MNGNHLLVLVAFVFNMRFFVPVKKKPLIIKNQKGFIAEIKMKIKIKYNFLFLSYLLLSLSFVCRYGEGQLACGAAYGGTERPWRLLEACCGARETLGFLVVF